MRTGTVATVDNRNGNCVNRPALSIGKPISCDSFRYGKRNGSANGYRFRVPYGTLLCVSDKPLHGELKLPGMASEFYKPKFHNI